MSLPPSGPLSASQRCRRRGGLTAVPAILSVALVGWSWKKRDKHRVRDAAGSRRIGRLVGVWSAAEGVAIFLAANILGNLAAYNLLVPIVSVIVGAHFLPLAHGLPMRIYYVTGGLLIALGTGATLTSYPLSWVLTGIGAALVLWLTAPWHLFEY